MRLMLVGLLAGCVTQRASASLSLVADVPLPGNATRFDYQDVDAQHGHLIVAHMGDSEVLVLSLSDGSVAKRVPGVATVRGVVAAPDANRIFASAIDGHVVVIDATTLAEVSRAETGKSPDGVAYDNTHNIVASSDQGAGALSLIADAGTGARTPVALGTETGNVIFDPQRGQFWVTVVRASPPDQLVSVDPVSGAVLKRFDLDSGCSGAHGLRLHPDGKSAFVACEDNNVLLRVDLETGAKLGLSPVGKGVDVLAIDPGLLRLYAAAESGDLVVFDIAKAGLVDIDHEHVADNAHSVAVDPATHRVFFPLMQGASGTPVLRIMKPPAQ
jgi:sugar lactone lactonase YvrE